MENRKHIPSYLTGSLIVVAIQIAGFALLLNKMAAGVEYIYLPTVPNTAVSPAEPRVAPSVGIDKAVVENIFREVIQSALKQEIAPYVRQLTAAFNTPPKALPADPSGVKENSPANEQAFSEAMNIAGSAIAKGKWTEADVLALQLHKNNLTSDQRTQLMEKIGNAINNQELKMEGIGPIF